MIIQLEIDEILVFSMKFSESIFVLLFVDFRVKVVTYNKISNGIMTSEMDLIAC